MLASAWLLLTGVALAQTPAPQPGALDAPGPAQTVMAQVTSGSTSTSTVPESGGLRSQSAAARTDPLWEVGLGAAALSMPHYRGSDRSRTWLLPMPFGVYRGEFLRADREGARARLVSTPRFSLQASLTAGTPASSEDDPMRMGMPDLAPTVEFGPAVHWRLAEGPGWNLETRLPVRAAFTVERSPQFVGWVASPSLNLDRTVGPWKFGFGATWLWASRRNTAYYYEVAPQFARSDRPAWQAGAGSAGTQWIASATWRQQDWWLGAFVRLDDLHGAVFDDSPMVRRRQTVAAGVAFAWVFAKSSQPARGRDD